MATYTVVSAKHATLSTTTVDTVNVSSNVGSVIVLNRSGTSDLTVTTSVGSTAATPVALADDTIIVPAGMSVVWSSGGARDQTVQVKVLGNGNAYSVQVI